MDPLVSYETRDGVAVVSVENPPVNALSPGVPEGIAAGLARAAADDAVVAAVLIGGGRTFIAGADIREFGKVTSGLKKRDSALPELLEKIERSPKLVVAAVHGTALGGGLETALACRARVALDSAQFGQPEVKLGIIPGAGGTQRLPRLVGAPKALEMCAFGEPIDARQALESGLIDAIIEGPERDDLLKGAIAFAREHADDDRPATSERVEKLANEEVAPELFERFRAAVRTRRRGFNAPFKAIDAVEAATRLPFEEGLRREAQIFRECLFSEESKALIHAFFAEREARKIPGLPSAPPRPVRRAAVVGAGTMGAGIAMVYVEAGIPVALQETSKQALDRGLTAIRRNYERAVAKGRLSAETAEARLGLITPTLIYEGFRDADVVVEAVFEDLDLKRAVFEELDRVAPRGAILATNTSTLDIDRIAAATRRPRDVIGHHFFSPANVMRLLEIVRGRETSPETIAASMALARRLRKVAVLAGNCVGFIGNRLFGPYRREAQFLVEEGAGIEQVDRVLYDFGMAMGPLAVGDLAGLDVGARIREQHPRLYPPGFRRPIAEDALCAAGRLGQKTGRGWYRYNDERRRAADPEAEAIVRRAAREAGVPRRTIADDEILDRCLCALIQEGARVLEEGHALRAGDIDVVYLNGYGFPAYRGGPMWYADRRGLAAILKRIKEFQSLGEHWRRPAPLLEESASSGRGFADWDRR